jgi:hypothetical protein
MFFVIMMPLGMMLSSYFRLIFISWLSAFFAGICIFFELMHFVSHLYLFHIPSLRLSSFRSEYRGGGAKKRYLLMEILRTTFPTFTM